MKKYKVGLLSLGCDKNRIDSEIVLSNLSDQYEIIDSEKEADIIIVNTCGFIESSKEESINAIIEMSQYKTKYSCKVLIATGCLTQRYGEELLENIPELDIILGVNDYPKLNSLIESKIKGEEVSLNVNYSDKNINEGKRILTTGVRTAYIRIAEGCDNTCSYCIIPKIRGKYRSRTMESILKEAKSLVESGVRELILVAQDSARYGVDIYEEKSLHKLVYEMCQIDDLKWIRLLYCYPEQVYDELIDVIADNDKVCKYLDIPIQHISDNVLTNMKRATRKAIITENIKKMRKRIKNLVLRTSIIVGFPGETEDDFSELLEFAKDIKFDKLGVFKYSREEDTEAYSMQGQIDEDKKNCRENELMTLQQGVSKSINRLKIGKTYEVLIEDEDEEYYYGRSFEMAPDIDGEIFVKKTTKLKISEFVNVCITDSLEYDLIGVVSDEFSQ